jgi:hypothetical protein
MQSVVLFIPRILPNVSKKQLVDRFAELHIGRITHIHSKYRVNEKNNEYWFAFLTITIWNTSEGCRFWNSVVVCKETICMDYFELGVSKHLYWEIQLCRRNNVNLKVVKEIPIFEETKEEIVVEGLVEGATVNPLPPLPPLIKMRSYALAKGSYALAKGSYASAKEVLEEGEIDESNLSKRDHLEIYQDYLELERCIFGSNYLCKLF